MDQSFTCWGFGYGGNCWPLPHGSHLGYWFDNMFVSADVFDLFLDFSITMYVLDERGIYWSLEHGTYPVFMYREKPYYSLADVYAAIKAANAESLPTLPSQSPVPEETKEVPVLSTSSTSVPTEADLDTVLINPRPNLK